MNRKMKWSRKLSVVEQRGTPLTALNITIGMWVRVRTDSDAVKKLCRGDGEDQVRHSLLPHLPPKGEDTNPQRTRVRMDRPGQQPRNTFDTPTDM